MFGSRSMRRILSPLAPLVLSASLLITASACSPVIDQRGYVPDPEKIQSIRPGIDNKTSVSGRLGSPSSIATFESNIWYYISSEEAKFAFFRPRTLKREILAIAFDDSALVREIARFDLEDGKEISLVGRETPTLGKELTFMEQMFGNIGRFDSSTLGDN